MAQTIVSIHQPSYFPWLGLLDKIRQCDTYVVMDEVQLADRAYQHRNLFLDAAGQPQYLSIPFARSGYREHTIRELAIADDAWRQRHWDFLRTNYGRHPHAAEVLGPLEAYYQTPHATLFEAILASMTLVLDWLQIRTRVVLQSSLDYDRGLRKGALIVALVRAAGGGTYLSGMGAAAYLAPPDFASEGLDLRWTSFDHPTYPQKGGRAFVPGLACLDALFNLGPGGCRELLGLTP